MRIGGALERKCGADPPTAVSTIARILQAQQRTRTADPFLTMEVLYQLS